MVVFWQIKDMEETQEDGTKKIKQIPILRFYNVFHISQIENLDPLEVEELKELEPIEEAEKVLKEYWSRENITVNHILGNKASYSPVTDIITLPLFEQFVDANEYYSTAYHESVHSTMKSSRCNREEDRKGKDVSFRSDEYSREELCAEIGSAMILNLIGVETSKTFKNSVAYVQSWLRVLRNDSKFIVSASSRAEKAVNYIMNTEVEG